MRKVLTIFMALFIVLSMSGVALAAMGETVTDATGSQSAEVKYEATEPSYWVLTVEPAVLTPYEPATVTLRGKWEPYKIRTVSAEKTVVMTNQAFNKETATVYVSDFGISKNGNHLEEVSEAGTITVDTENAMSQISFGTWTGTLTFSVHIADDSSYEGGSILTAVTTEALSSAFSNAKDGDTIVLSPTVTTDEIMIPANTAKVTIDGNGATVGKLTIDPSVEELTFKNLKVDTVSGNLITVDQSEGVKSLTFDGCTLTAATNNNQYGFASQNLGPNPDNSTIAKPDLIFKDCTFESVKYGVYDGFNGVGSITVDGCTFKGITSWCISTQKANYGGTGNVTITNCDFVDCTGLLKAQAMDAGSTLTITGNTFTNCKGKDNNPERMVEMPESGVYLSLTDVTTDSVSTIAGVNVTINGNTIPS